MSTPLRFKWLVILLLGGLGSCVSAKEFQVLQTEVAQTKKLLAEVQRSETKHGLMMETSFRDIIAHLECPNEDVRKLVVACALAKSECSPTDIERVVGMMSKMHHTLAYYRPGQHATQQIPERLGLLRTLIQGHQHTINTKVLLLVLPYANLNAKASQEAEVLGEEYREYVQKLTQQLRPDVRIPVIEPKIIGCERGQELIRKYEGEKNDRPYAGVEPTSKERRAVIWTFMVDC